jgi:hypothetical protein
MNKQCLLIYRYQQSIIFFLFTYLPKHFRTGQYRNARSHEIRARTPGSGNADH